MRLIANKQFLVVFLLIFLSLFLIPSRFCLAGNFKDITPREIRGHLAIPQNKVESLIHSLINLLTSKWIDELSSPSAGEEESAVPSIMRGVARAESLNYLLVDAPVDVGFKIVNNSVKVAGMFLSQDVSGVLDKIEKESVKMAINYGMRALMEKEIRISPGAIEFKYESQKGKQEKTVFQYVMVYKPVDTRKGNLLIRFYSRDYLEPPANRGSIGGSWGQYTGLTHPLPPFILDIRGMVEDYNWTEKPSIDISFPDKVPDLGIKPLNFWQRHLVKPIKEQINNVDVIIAEITGKSPNLMGKISAFWNGIRSVVQKTQGVAHSGGALLAPPKPSPSEPLSSPKSPQSKPLPKTSHGTSNPPVPAKNPQKKIGQTREKGLSFSEAQKEIKEISDRIKAIEAEAEKLGALQETRKPEQATSTKKQNKKRKPRKSKKSLEPCSAKSIDINTAQKKDLDRLTGVGPVLAQRIIESRPFHSLDDLTKVRGIGPKTLEKIIAQNCAFVSDSYRISRATGTTGTTGATGSSGSNPSSTPKAKPKLSVSLNHLDFEAIKDVGAASQSLTIANSGGSDLNWRLSSSAAWLNFSPSKGLTSPDASSTIYVSVNINGMATGTAGATLSIDASGAENSPQNISITLNIHEKKFAQGLVISEIEIWDATSSNDDFVEIYNPTGSVFDISGFQLKKKSSTGKEYSVRLFPSGSYVPAKGYFLWLNSHFDSLLNIADATSSQTLSKNNSIALLDKNKNVVDAVAWGSGSNPFVETSPFPENPEKGKSLSRKMAMSDDGKPAYLDLNDNQLDFSIKNPSPKAGNENLPPVAKFDFSPERSSIYVGDNILFDASGSYDPEGGGSLVYIWSFSSDISSSTSSTSSASERITRFFTTSTTSTISLSVVDNMGATSTPTSTEIFIKARPARSLVINEIGWAGTRASTTDQWIEFYNNTTSSIDIVNWSIDYKAGGKENCLNFSQADGFSTTTISANGYLLYGRSQKGIYENSQPAVDIWQSGLKMENASSSQLLLIDVPYCQRGDLIDAVGPMADGWFAGSATDSVSMERVSATTTAAASTNWQSNNLITRNGKDPAGNSINGTPGEKNSVSYASTSISGQHLSQLFNEFSEITLTYFGSPYLAQDDLTIPAGKTLNIEAGVEMKFKGNRWGTDYNMASLYINGRLVARGSPSRKITLTSFSPPAGSAGWWGQIHFSSSSRDSILENTIIENGGRALCQFCPAIALSVKDTSVKIKDSLIENTSRSGLELINSSSTIDGLTVEDCHGGQAIYINGGAPTISHSAFKNTYSGMSIEGGSRAEVVDSRFENIQYSDGAVSVKGSYPLLRNNSGDESNGLNGISLSGSVSQNWTLYPNDDFSYVISDSGFTVASSSQLVVQPGTIIKVKEHSRLTINGKITANGSSTNQIVFTSLTDNDYGGRTSPAGGRLYWDYLNLAPGSGGSFKNVIFRYGGAPSNKGAVYVQGRGIDFENDIFKDNGGPSLYIENASTTVVADSSFEKCWIGVSIAGQCPRLSHLSFATTTYPFCRGGCTTSTDPVSICP